MLSGHQVIVPDNPFTGSKANIHWIGYPHFEFRYDIIQLYMVRKSITSTTSHVLHSHHYQYNLPGRLKHQWLRQ
jgi:hypothetical protein